jgi:hypothetical protein
MPSLDLHFMSTTRPLVKKKDSNLQQHKSFIVVLLYLCHHKQREHTPICYQHTLHTDTYKYIHTYIRAHSVPNHCCHYHHTNIDLNGRVLRMNDQMLIDDDEQMGTMVNTAHHHNSLLLNNNNNNNININNNNNNNNYVNHFSNNAAAFQQQQLGSTLHHKHLSNNNINNHALTLTPPLKHHRHSYMSSDTFSDTTAKLHRFPSFSPSSNGCNIGSNHMGSNSVGMIPTTPVNTIAQSLSDVSHRHIHSPTSSNSPPFCTNTPCPLFSSHPFPNGSESLQTSHVKIKDARLSILTTAIFQATRKFLSFPLMKLPTGCASAPPEFSDNKNPFLQSRKPSFNDPFHSHSAGDLFSNTTSNRDSISSTTSTMSNTSARAIFSNLTRTSSENRLSVSSGGNRHSIASVGRTSLNIENWIENIGHLNSDFNAIGGRHSLHLSSIGSPRGSANRLSLSSLGSGIISPPVLSPREETPTNEYKSFWISSNHPKEPFMNPLSHRNSGGGINLENFRSFQNSGNIPMNGNGSDNADSGAPLYQMRMLQSPNFPDFNQNQQTQITKISLADVGNNSVAANDRNNHTPSGTGKWNFGSNNSDGEHNKADESSNTKKRKNRFLPSFVGPIKKKAKDAMEDEDEEAESPQSANSSSSQGRKKWGSLFSKVLGFNKQQPQANHSGQQTQTGQQTPPVQQMQASYPTQQQQQQQIINMQRTQQQMQYQQNVQQQQQQLYQLNSTFATNNNNQMQQAQQQQQASSFYSQNGNQFQVQQPQNLSQNTYSFGRNNTSGSIMSQLGLNHSQQPQLQPQENSFNPQLKQQTQTFWLENVRRQSESNTGLFGSPNNNQFEFAIQKEQQQQNQQSFPLQAQHLRQQQISSQEFNQVQQQVQTQPIQQKQQQGSILQQLQIVKPESPPTPTEQDLDDAYEEEEDIGISDGDDYIDEDDDGNAEDRPFKCPQCPKSFTHITNLKRHVKLHNGNKPFCCTHPGCDKRFARRSDLQTHVRIHTGERPYVCSHDGCGKRFTTCSNLRRHEKIHQKKGKRDGAARAKKKAKNDD